MTHLTTRSTSLNTAEIEEEFVLDETLTTRRIFKANIVKNLKEPSACVNGYIIHQRKGVNDKWEDIKDLKLSNLKSGEAVKFNFSSGEMKKFYDALERSYAIGNDGVKIGRKELVVEEADKFIAVPADRKQLIVSLLQKDYGVEIWKELLAINPDLASRLSLARIQADRSKSLNEFEQSLKHDKGESYWQDFFERNHWIFGYGLRLQFLHLLQNQPNYGGVNITGTGIQKGDFLLHTAAEIKFTVPVEIKKPEAKLFAYTRLGEVAQYRNGVPVINYELTGAISQIQVNSKTWEIEGSNSSQNSENLQKEKIFTHSPKGILVIGHTNQLDTFEKRKAFELFRSNIHNPEIITFDELFERAKYIVANEDNIQTSEDLPF